LIINKQEIIKEYATKSGDTGSSKVQIAILTKKIELLTKHVQKFKKDTSSRRGLLLMIERRRKLLSYIKKKNLDVYSEILSKLGLRK
jgi:small subunit ribosomal protein S15|tara:strand:- start:72 stop:332 length:261 start_codon:yes stop_codon:yes gene_type:complete